MIQDLHVSAPVTPRFKAAKVVRPLSPPGALARPRAVRSSGASRYRLSTSERRILEQSPRGHRHQDSTPSKAATMPRLRHLVQSIIFSLNNHCSIRFVSPGAEDHSAGITGAWGRQPIAAA